MDENGRVRWGVLSTARIGASNFLPSLRAAGNGNAFAVASRSLDAARKFAAANGVEHAIQGYEKLLADDRIDAVYISLPNGLHAEWTIAALRAGKAVLCEKSLCISLAQTQEVLDVAVETGNLLWEAFVFPFQQQMLRVREILDAGEIGDVQEIRSVFHFPLSNPTDIRLSPELGGGALFDVGCYCVHLATILLGAQPERAVSMVTWTPSRVEETTQGIVEYPNGVRLVFSCSIGLPGDTGSTIAATRGRIELTNPFHARSGDRLELVRGDARTVEHVGGNQPSFTDALRHINAAIRGELEPLHLAVTDSLPTAAALELVRGDSA